MSAFEGTPLDVALRDGAIRSFLVVGVAIEIGIEPTIRQGADLGYIPIVVEDACGAGDEKAGSRALASQRDMGDALSRTSTRSRPCFGGQRQRHEGYCEVAVVLQLHPADQLAPAEPSWS